MKQVAVSLSLMLLAAACGDDSGSNQTADSCENETRADEFIVGLDKVGQNGLKVVLLEATPARPAKGDNDWRIQVLDATDTALDGLQIGVTPWMPDHGHGTTVKTVVSEVEGATGEYTLSPVNLWMPGLWTVTLNINDSADEVVFATCIEG